MPPFIALAWRPGDGEANALVKAFDRGLGRDWASLLRAEGLGVYGVAARPLRCRTLGQSHGAVFGDLFMANGAEAPDDLAEFDRGRLPDRASRLVESYWGRYIAIFRNALGEQEGVLRDPGGALDVALWRRGGVWIAASDPSVDALADLRLPHDIDWGIVHEHLYDFSLTTARCALRQVHALAPGALCATPLTGEPTVSQIWRPARFGGDVVADRVAATGELRRRVETCVQSLAASCTRGLVEVSGGLDSSIVGACLANRCGSNLRWLHHVSDGRGGDERVFARRLGSALEIEVVERGKSEFGLDPEEVMQSQAGLRPSGSGLDTAYDHDLTALGRAWGSDSIFTGVGGDNVFFAAATPDIAVDRLRRLGPAAIFDHEFLALARWSRQSAWRLGRGASWGALTEPPRRRPAEPAWLTPTDFSGRDHPWLADIENLPPAKTSHIEQMADALLFHGRSERGQAMDVVHPLLAQPILEHCLRIPVDVLTHGGQDRAVARDAFRDRLPPEIIDRRSKGELSVYYSRAFMAGLPALRSFLLDGRLAAQGLLRRAPLETALTQSHLAQFGGLGALLRVIAVEGWARRH